MFVPYTPAMPDHYSDRITHSPAVAALVTASDAMTATWSAAYLEWAEAAGALPAAETADVAAMRAAVVADKPTPKELAPAARDRLARAEMRVTLTGQAADQKGWELRQAHDAESESLVTQVLDGIDAAAEQYAGALTVARSLADNAYQGLQSARSTVGLLVAAAKRAGQSDPRHRVEGGVSVVTWPGSQPAQSLTASLDRLRADFARAARVTPAPSE